MRLGLRRLPVLKALWTKNTRPTWRDSERTGDCPLLQHSILLEGLCCT